MAVVIMVSEEAVDGASVRSNWKVASVDVTGNGVDVSGETVSGAVVCSDWKVASVDVTEVGVDVSRETMDDADIWSELKVSLVMVKTVGLDRKVALDGAQVWFTLVLKYVSETKIGVKLVGLTVVDDVCI